ncbi:MAG: glycosyltransferase family protein [Alphaproteobacteria bacterium]
MTRRALILVTHLLGTGHLARAALIARALERLGVATTLVSGGLPVPGLATGAVDVVQLPPVRAEDARFRRLVDGDGRAVDESLLAARRAAVLDAFRATAPHIVVVEHYPFGRRKLAAEFQALIAAARAARPPAVVVGSVRDILVAQADPARHAAMAAAARAELDALLVHGDRRVVAFEASFPLAASLAGRIVYTGYVAQPLEPMAPGGPGRGEVVVSAGGGAVGEALIDAALGAAALDPGRRWRLLAGPALAGGARDRLARGAGANTTTEANRPDFRRVLANCSVSVSQAGYNTMVDVLMVRARAVVVPFSAEGQTEQAVRAERLAAMGLVHVIAEADLAPAVLADMVARVATLPRPPSGAVDLAGAERTAELLDRWSGLGHADVARAQ